MKDSVKENGKEMLEQCKRDVAGRIAELNVQLEESQRKNDTMENNVASLTEKLEQITLAKVEDADEGSFR